MIIRLNGALRLTGLAVLATSLAGCLGSGSGGNGGGGAGGGGGTTPPADAFAAYDSAFADATANVLANAPTSDMPTSGQASFSGQAKVEQVMNSDGSLAADAILADINLGVTFGSGSSGTITGTADNIRRSLDGKVETYDGVTLTTQYADSLSLPSTIATNTNTINVPGRGNITTRTGSYQVNMAAPVTVQDIPDLDADGDMLLTLGGTFTGAGAQGSFGTASAQLFNGTVRAAGGSGTHYTKRD